MSHDEPWAKPDTDNRTLRSRAPSLVGDGTQSTGQPESDTTRQVLVCGSCEVYYDHDDAWVHCPQCSGELLEVERA